MKIKDKLALMKELTRRNDERWSITSHDKEENGELHHEQADTND